MALASDLLASEESTSKWLPDDQRLEAESVSRITRIPVGQVVLLQAFYDLTASETLHHKACTSIIAQSKAESTPPVHGRNLDYSFHEAMLLLAVQIDWQRNNRTVFRSVTVLPQVGFNTVVRPGAWSLSHDERDQGFIGKVLYTEGRGELVGL